MIKLMQATRLFRPARNPSDADRMHRELAYEIVDILLSEGVIKFESKYDPETGGAVLIARLWVAMEGKIL